LRHRVHVRILTWVYADMQWTKNPEMRTRGNMKEDKTWRYTDGWSKNRG